MEFDVKMDASVLYDYYLYHTYRSMAGLIGTIVGILLVANFATSKNALYLIFGVIVIFYLPVTLYTSSKKQMLTVEAYKSPIHYKFDDEGMHVSQGETEQSRGWSDFKKAVSTTKSLILYTDKNVATIIPRAALGEDVTEMIKYICAHMDPKNVKIRF